MLNSFANILLGKKSTSDTMYESAIAATESLMNRIKIRSGSCIELDNEKAKFFKIYDNDPNSPTILWISDDEYIIYYPPNSTPYISEFDDKCKFVEVLKGVIFDKKSQRKIFKGDKIKISTTDNYEPYTTEKEAYIRVCVADCNTIWDNVCK